MRLLGEELFQKVYPEEGRPLIPEVSANHIDRLKEG
jgi:hypothetical protein